MGKTYPKPPVAPAWSENNTTAADLLVPANTVVQTGFPVTNTPFTRQLLNWFFNSVSSGLRYFMQRGLPDWDSQETYATGARVIGNDGETYTALTGTVGNAPSSSPGQWTRWGFTQAELTTQINGAGLAYTPVQQGGGNQQVSTNKLYLGWDGVQLRLQVDATDEGAIALKSDLLKDSNIKAPTYAGTNPDGTASITDNGASGGIIASKIIYNQAKQNVENTLQIKDAQIAALNSGAAAEVSNRNSAIATEAAARANADAGLQASLNTFAGLFSANAAARGHVWIGSGPSRVLLQWMPGTTVNESGVSTQSGTWDLAFPNAILLATCTTLTGQGGQGSPGDTDVHNFQLTGYTTSGWSVRHSVGGVYGQSQNLTPLLWAVGY